MDSEDQEDKYLQLVVPPEYQRTCSHRKTDCFICGISRTLDAHRDDEGNYFWLEFRYEEEEGSLERSYSFILYKDGSSNIVLEGPFTLDEILTILNGHYPNYHSSDVEFFEDSISVGDGSEGKPLRLDQRSIFEASTEVGED